LAQPFQAVRNLSRNVFRDAQGLMQCHWRNPTETSL
jgi:hypothetical protein